MPRQVTYHTSQKWKSSQDHSNKGKSDHNWRTRRVRLEGMMDLREFAVSQNFSGWDRLIRAPID